MIVLKHIGYGQSVNGYTGTYGSHYGDDTGCAGYQKVSFNRDKLFEKYGNEQIPIIIRAHWWSTKYDGNFQLKVNTSGSKIFKNTYNCSTQSHDTGSSGYQTFCTCYYNAVSDTFTIG